MYNLQELREICRKQSHCIQAHADILEALVQTELALKKQWETFQSTFTTVDVDMMSYEEVLDYTKQLTMMHTAVFAVK